MNAIKNRKKESESNDQRKGEDLSENKGRLDMELNTKMIGHCKLDCTEGLDYCCICCPKKEECKTQCGDLDKYEYTENCPDYSGIKVIE